MSSADAFPTDSYGVHSVISGRYMAVNFLIFSIFSHAMFRWEICMNDAILILKRVAGYLKRDGKSREKDRNLGKLEG